MPLAVRLAIDITSCRTERASEGPPVRATLPFFSVVYVFNFEQRGRTPSIEKVVGWAGNGGAGADITLLWPTHHEMMKGLPSWTRRMANDGCFLARYNESKFVQIL